MPPQHCAPHSITCPATTAPAMASTSSSPHPKACRPGPTVSDASVTRPVTTTCAPAASASAIGRAPRYALAVTSGASRGSGSPVSRLTNALAAAARSGTRAVRSSPDTEATRTATPWRRASSRTALASPSGLSPPAFDTMVMPRSMQVGRTSSSCCTNVRAIPAAALPGLVQDVHRQFGQPVTGEHVDGAALHHLLGGREPITEEPAAVGHPQELGPARHEDGSTTTRMSPTSTWSPGAHRI